MGGGGGGSGASGGEAGLKADWTRGGLGCYKGGVQAQNEGVRAAALSAGLRRYLLLTAAVGGGTIMIVEILGAKMLAPYVGTSHFVWTAQIAVTMLALAGGYALRG